MTRRLFVILSKEELSQLHEWMRDLALKKKFRQRLKGNAIFMSNQCKTVAQIALDLKRSTRTVYNWLRLYRRQGLAGILPRIYPRRLSREQVQELLKVSRWYLVGAHSKEFHKRWTFREMSEWVYKTWNIKLSPNRIRQIIRESMLNGDIPRDKQEK
jgi:transposase